MPTPDFHYSFKDAQGKTGAQVDLSYPGGGSSGRIRLHIAPTEPPETRAHELVDYNNLASALHFAAKLDTAAGTIEIITPDRSPEGLMLFISKHMEDAKITGSGSSRAFVDAMHQHEQKSFAAMHQTISDLMKNAVSQAHKEDIHNDFAKAGGQLTPSKPKQDPAVSTPIEKAVQAAVTPIKGRF